MDSSNGRVGHLIYKWEIDKNICTDLLAIILYELVVKKWSSRSPLGLKPDVFRFISKIRRFEGRVLETETRDIVHIEVLGCLGKLMGIAYSPIDPEYMSSLSGGIETTGNFGTLAEEQRLMVSSRGSKGV